MLYFAILESKYSLISDFTYNLNTIAWIIIFVTFAIVLLLSVWKFLRKPLSKFMKIKTARVEVLHLQGYGMNAKGRRFYSVSDSTVAVRFLEPKKRRRKIFYMSYAGLNVGDTGVFKYQGAYGVSFEKDGSVLQDQQERQYRFGFDKDKKEEVKPVERKKRKYW